MNAYTYKQFQIETWADAQDNVCWQVECQHGPEGFVAIDSGAGITEADAERAALIQAKHDIDMLIADAAENALRDRSTAPYAWMWESCDLLHDYPAPEDRESLILSHAGDVYDFGEWKANFETRYGVEPEMSLDDFLAVNELDLRLARNALSARWDQLVSESMA